MRPSIHWGAHGIGWAAAVVFGFMLVLAMPSAVQAGGVVGTGTPATCTGNAYPRPIGAACDVGATEYGFLAFLPVILR